MTPRRFLPTLSKPAAAPAAAATCKDSLQLQPTAEPQEPRYIIYGYHYSERDRILTETELHERARRNPDILKVAHPYRRLAVPTQPTFRRPKWT